MKKSGGSPPSDRGPGSRGMTYREAGVDIQAASRFVSLLGRGAKSTFTRGVVTDIGSFGAVFDLAEASGEGTVLVSSVDGVGTKLKVAFMTGRHDTVGEDLVNHCVNDIMSMGARPLFFLDYIATGKVDEEVLSAVARGLVRGCRRSGVALIGGETAEMPGFYPEGEYDLVGFIVGRVQRERIIDGRGVREGDVLIGLASSGLHTNGYSLARKIMFEVAGLGPDDPLPGTEQTVADALLAVHRCYYPSVGPLVSEFELKGIAHITGGGIVDNLPRVLPEGLSARISKGSWPVPRIFSYLQEVGGVDEGEMFRTFNMGIGLILVVSPGDAAAVMERLGSAGEKAYLVGEVVAGGAGVVLT